MFFKFSEDKYVVAKRKTYLHLIKKYRDEGRDIFFMDETYCEFGLTLEKLSNLVTI